MIKGDHTMSIRVGFEEELHELKNLVLEMSVRATQALKDSVEALVTQNIDQALKVIDKDFKINRIDREINEQAVWLVAKEQPVATDLRRVLSSVKISTDLERIGDSAVNIAKSTIRIGEKKLFQPLQDLSLMAEKVIEMIDEVMVAFKEEDTERARITADLDNALDEMFGTFVQQLSTYVVEDPEGQSQLTQLAFVCRDLERVGDHVTNISENIIFTKIGQIYELNA